jgi:hypothetical protein
MNGWDYMGNEFYKWALSHQWQKQMEPIRSALVQLQKQMEPIKAVSQRYAELNRSFNMSAEVRQAISSFQAVTERYAKLNRSLTIPAEALRQVISSSKAATQIADTLAPLRNILERNTAILNNVSIPHMPLYRDILESIDEGHIYEVFEEQSVENMEEDLSQQEEVTIVNPYFFNVAVTINIYETMTENHIYNNPTVSQEEKTSWEKYIKPILAIIGTMFLAWAMGDTPIEDTQIIEQFSKVMEVIENYQHPIETTDVEIKNKEEI